MPGGWTAEQIAEIRKVSLPAIPPEVQRVVAERRLDAPDRYVHFQVARLTKALRVADAAFDRGEVKAVVPMVRVVAALNRYHGLPNPNDLRAAARSLAAPPPPLALSHAGPACEGIEVQLEKRTVFGA